MLKPLRKVKPRSLTAVKDDATDIRFYRVWANGRNGVPSCRRRAILNRRTGGSRVGRVTQVPTHTGAKIRQNEARNPKQIQMKKLECSKPF